MGSYNQVNLMTSLDRLENTQKPTNKVENTYKVKNLDHLGLIAAHKMH